MTGLVVTAVNISVDGVNVPKTDKKDQSEPETEEVEDTNVEAVDESAKETEE